MKDRDGVSGSREVQLSVHFLLILNTMTSLWPPVTPPSHLLHSTPHKLLMQEHFSVFLNKTCL